MTDRNDFDPKAHNPTFQWGFVAFKNWGTWLAIIFGLPIALLPKSVHIWIARRVANYMSKRLVKHHRSTARNIWVNLSLCFPDKSDQEKEQIFKDCLTTAGAFLLSFPLISLLGKRYLDSNTEIEGLEHLQKLQESGDNIILLTPHTWAIDVLPILLASKGSPVVAMIKEQKDPIGDWLMHRQRMQFGGRIYERSAGIKPYMKSIREGYIGYYLPDQDHGREQSVFVDFFGVPKATLPGLGKLAKVSRAKVVPAFTRYNIKTGKYEVKISPVWDDFPSGDELVDARRQNAFIEQALENNIEQYMWNFQLLKSRPNLDDANPYREEKYKKRS